MADHHAVEEREQGKHLHHPRPHVQELEATGLGRHPKISHGRPELPAEDEIAEMMSQERAKYIHTLSMQWRDLT